MEIEIAVGKWATSTFQSTKWLRSKSRTPLKTSELNEYQLVVLYAVSFF